VVRNFAGNAMVSFGDVNLSENVVGRGPPHNPGQGGWPTIRYFNKETGPQGASYEKKTGDAMCTELGKEDNMIAYIEQAGMTSLCALDGTGCDEKSLKYLDAMKEKSVEDQKKEFERLEKMQESDMTPQLKDWLNKRIRLMNILLQEQASANAEL
jgi:hypothetical protein